MDVRRRRQQGAAAAEERRMHSARARRPRRAPAPRRLRRPRRTPRSSRPSRRPARRRSRRRAVGAARNQASTPSDSHQAPIPSHARSEARHTSTARVSPTRSRRIGEVVPQRRDEAAVATARPVTGETGLEHDDVEPRLERLQLPGGPEPEVAGSDDDDVGRRVALERRRSARHGARLLEPVPVPRVPRAAHAAEGILSWLRGGGSSVGRAPGCDPGGRGFKSRPPPFPSFRLGRAAP